MDMDQIRSSFAKLLAGMTTSQIDEVETMVDQEFAKVRRIRAPVSVRTPEAATSRRASEISALIDREATAMWPNLNVSDARLRYFGCERGQKVLSAYRNAIDLERARPVTGEERTEDRESSGETRTFTERLDRAAKTLAEVAGLSYGDALSRIFREQPESYERYVQAGTVNVGPRVA